MREDGYGAEVGMRVTCQLCGNEIFMKQIGYNNVNAAIANRHSMLDQFEPIPDGWKNERDLGGWCCPKCKEKYKQMIKDFMMRHGGVK